MPALVPHGLDGDVVVDLRVALRVAGDARPGANGRPISASRSSSGSALSNGPAGRVGVARRARTRRPPRTRSAGPRCRPGARRLATSRAARCGTTRYPRAASFSASSSGRLQALGRRRGHRRRSAPAAPTPRRPARCPWPGTPRTAAPARAAAPAQPAARIMPPPPTSSPSALLQPDPRVDHESAAGRTSRPPSASACPAPAIGSWASQTSRR